MSLYPTIISSATGLRPKPKPTAKKAALKPKPAPTDGQLAEQQIDPLIKSITDRVNARATGAEQAVTGYGNSLASYLSGIDYAAPERQAIPQQAAVDAALQQSLTGKGNDLAQSLSSRLASIQEPGAIDPAVQAVQQFGAGTGSTQLAQGSASIGNLLANQASAGEYGLKQPGIARTATLQGIGKVGAQAVNDIADQTGALTAKVPDIVANIQSNRAKQQQIGLETRLANKKYGLDLKKTNASINQTNQRLTVEETNAITAQQNANTSAQNASTSAASQTESARHNRATEAAAKAAAQGAVKRGGVTANQAAAIAKAAAKDAEDLYHGKSHTNAQGQTIIDSYTQTYQDAVKTLMNRYPTLGRAGAMKLVNSWYKPGEYGRPKSPAQSQSHPRKAGTTMKDAAGDTYVWNGTSWVKQ